MRCHLEAFRRIVLSLFCIRRVVVWGGLGLSPFLFVVADSKQSYQTMFCKYFPIVRLLSQRDCSEHQVQLNFGVCAEQISEASRQQGDWVTAFVSYDNLLERLGSEDLG